MIRPPAEPAAAGLGHDALLACIAVRLADAAGAIGPGVPDFEMVERSGPAPRSPQVMVAHLQSQPWHSLACVGRHHRVTLWATQAGDSIRRISRLVDRLGTLLTSTDLGLPDQVVVDGRVTQLETRMDAAAGVVRGVAVIELFSVTD